MERKLYCNHFDIFLDLPTNPRERLLEIQKTCASSHEALKWLANAVFGKTSKYQIFYKITIIYIYKFCFEFSTTHTGKGYDSQILFPVIIYYNIVSFTKF